MTRLKSDRGTHPTTELSVDEAADADHSVPRRLLTSRERTCVTDLSAITTSGRVGMLRINCWPEAIAGVYKYENPAKSSYG